MTARVRGLTAAILLALFPALVTAAPARKAAPLLDPYAGYTRIAYARVAGGGYLLRSMPLFDVVCVGGVQSCGGASGGSLATPVSLANGGTGLSSAADDTTLVSNGSVWQAKGLPACTDTGGNHLNYDTATNTFSCGTTGGGGGGANTALSNLASVAVNLSLIPGAAGTLSLGSATLPWKDLFFAGTSGTPGTNNFQITGVSTSGTRIITAPDASTSLPIATQVLTWTGPTAARTITLPDSNTTLPSATQIITWTGPTAARTYTLPDAAATLFNNNVSSIPGVAGTLSLGSVTLPFKDLFFAGTSGTPGTNNFQITGVSTGGARVITAPDASTSLPIATQFITWTGPTAARTYTLRDANDTIASLGATNAFTGTNSFLDGSFSIKNTADNTKVLNFSVSGVTTGNAITPFGFGGTAAAPWVSIPAGIFTQPGIVFATSTNTGLWARSAGVIDASTSGAWVWETNNVGNGLIFASTSQIGFSSSTSAGGVNDVFFKRGAAARMQMGADLNGAAINQTFGACNGITGTDILGCGLTLQSGLGTGGAVSNPLTLNRQIAKATGTTAQTTAPAFLTCISKILSNTSATVQTVALITTTTTSAGAVDWHYTVVASNGTVLDSDTGKMGVAWNNNAGTVAVNAGTAYATASSPGSGTLASTPTVTVATNVVSFKLSPTWTTIVPTTVTQFSTFQYNGATDTVTCQ